MSEKPSQWIKDALARTGRSQKGLAVALGITQPQVSRLVAGKRALRATEIPICEQYFGLRYPQHSLPLIEVHSLSDPRSVATLPVLVVIAQGVWRDKGATVLDQALIAASPDPRLGGVEQYTCRVDGLNTVVGQYVVCVPYSAIRLTPTDGDLVHVIRTRADLEEHTLRVVSVRNGKTLLMPYGGSGAAPIELTPDVEMRGLIVAFTTPVRF